MNNNIQGNLAPLYKSDYFMPKYECGEYGEWRISMMGLGHDYGYTSGVWMVSEVPILSRRNKDSDSQWESWMSLTPHEIESQELGIKYGFGHMVVMGLGLGWLAINAALNLKITKITVIELDPSVIELFHNSGALNGLEDNIRDKITVICEDALKWEPDKKVDFLYADIWKNLNEENALNDVRNMQSNIGASVIYYWGQELTIYNAIKDNSSGDKKISFENIKHTVNNIFSLPLLIPQDIDYPEMINQVVKNRLQRRLKV